MSSVNRRGFLRGAAVAAAAGGTALLAPAHRPADAQEPIKRPNIIFILADDWGWGDLGCYGHKQLKTPNLDKMASQGTLFTQFYACSPVCSPSRAAFMTGQFPAKLGFHTIVDPNNRQYGVPEFLDPKIPTLTRLLHDAGYATGHFGKWHLGAKNAPSPSAYGIDESIAFVSNDPTALDKLGKKNRPNASTRIVDEAIGFLEAHKDKPVFLNLWLLDTHAKLEPTAAQMEAYPGLPPGSARRTYYSAATDSDKQIGRLLAKLDEMGIAKNTLVLFASDNGPEETTLYDPAVGSSGPFRGRKRSLYEGGVRLPFIVRWPGKIPAGKINNDAIIAGVDFVPTLCKIAGVPLPAGLPMDGMDTSEILRGAANAPRPRPLFWEWRFNIIGPSINKSPMLAMREGKWKLLMNPDKSRVELYDIPADPMEVDNVAVQNPAVAAKMSKQLLAWKATLPPGKTGPGAGSASYPWPNALLPGASAVAVPEPKEE